METKPEGVFTVYKKGVLVAIIKRDDLSGKHLVYSTKEATGDVIAELLDNKE